MYQKIEPELSMFEDSKTKRKLATVSTNHDEKNSILQAQISRLQRMVEDLTDSRTNEKNYENGVRNEI